MRLKIASRRSDLARWQAVQTARQLEKDAIKPSFEFIFKSSLGDQNLDLPLASMGSKGVFTEDFYADLTNGHADLVVHSWKDLPIDDRSLTHIAMTLPRADVRDLLLVPDKVWRLAMQTGHLNVFTSSPRRVYNLRACLHLLLPGEITVEFHNVRGNVPTRLRKMHEAGYGLVLAKAGLDRLLAAESEGFLPEDATIRPLLKDCQFQVLPVSLNPPAPAQGALAIEVLRDNDTVNALCARSTDETTFACVLRERQILKSFGGGCHQKIGAAVLPREYGHIFALRGLTDAGQELNQWYLENSDPWVRAQAKSRIFPFEARDNRWFERIPIDLKIDWNSLSAIYIARAEALPKDVKPNPQQIVWTAGTQTWMKLARQGIWVNGCSDGLGEREDPQLNHLVGAIRWTKLTHSLAGGAGEQLATYELRPLEQSPDLRGKTHFYWMSRTSFERAYELFPNEIQCGYNACGPGVTYDFLKGQSSLVNPVKVFIGLEQFLAESLP